MNFLAIVGMSGSKPCESWVRSSARRVDTAGFWSCRSHARCGYVTLWALSQAARPAFCKEAAVGEEWRLPASPQCGGGGKPRLGSRESESNPEDGARLLGLRRSELTCPAHQPRHVMQLHPSSRSDASSPRLLTSRRMVYFPKTLLQHENEIFSGSPSFLHHSSCAPTAAASRHPPGSLGPAPRPPGERRQAPPPRRPRPTPAPA